MKKLIDNLNRVVTVFLGAFWVSYAILAWYQNQPIDHAMFLILVLTLVVWIALNDYNNRGWRKANDSHMDSLEGWGKSLATNQTLLDINKIVMDSNAALEAQVRALGGTPNMAPYAALAEIMKEAKRPN